MVTDNSTDIYIEHNPISIKKRRTGSKMIRENIELLILALPAVIYFFVWHYLPMTGIILAFKNYTYEKGIFGSDWAGLKNFDYFFKSQDAWRLVRNTVGYSFTFIVLGIIAAVTVALLMFELDRKGLVKFFQTTMILPRFLSWVVVSFIVYSLLSPSNGFINHILSSFGIGEINWYSDSKYWPGILILVEVWKGIGMSSIMYYAALMGVDESLYEAAEIDGASRLQQTRYISIPSLIPLMTILGTLALGNIFRGDFGLFYQVPMDIGVLYPTTDIIDTYVYRGLRNSQYAMTTAVGLFQSVVGLCCILTANKIVKKIDPERALF